jgi:serine/threonine-protein kinase HipA
MHLKNWSLLYPDGRTPILSPAYDFVNTLVYISGDKTALSFGGEHNLHRITFDQVLRFADKASLGVGPIWRIVQETIELTVSAWKTLDQKEILPTQMRQAIGDHIQGVASETGRSG